MPNIFYEVRVADAFGTHLATVANFTDGPSGAALAYALNVGQIGVLELTVPATFNVDLLKLDGRLGVWRSIDGRSPRLDGDAIFLIRRWEYGDDYTKVVAYHANHLLSRRIIAYAAGSSYASKSATNADNLIKTFVSQNMLAGIVSADRDGAETQADLSSYVTNQANLGLGASIAKGCARRRLLDVVQELSQASTQAGTYLTAEIVAPTESTLELRTYATTRGVDHSATSSQPVILSVLRGNLENALLVIDRSEEVTFAIAGGQGQEAARLIATASDSTRMGESPFNRIEAFVDMANVSDSTQLQDDADAAVRAGRPVRIFSGDLVETESTVRGIHFDLGDIVTAEHRGQQLDCRLDVIAEEVRGGQRRTTAQLRSTT